MITRTFIQNFELTPYELANEFCNMGDDEQAEFFNNVASITEKWKSPFCCQLQSIIDNKKLTNEGRHIMEIIGKYGKQNS